ncbi:DUF1905 domain-containing protein [Nocardioides coralli]|uniref:DUF1905 domain-containing protein n=1 Tax=Nocardioides coralli TaxID=2872154 RepID=UPI001CA3D5E6|nr:DUF1905 domain-containing protein [Nocardioides coralli]QZY28668.1 DUF1905 domain-containing protein [Nocardioides coralli]
MDAWTFTAPLWPWEARPDSWVFLTVPPEVSDEIEDRMVARAPRGFGSVRVEVTIGGSTWRTSVFPSKEEAAYVLPVKKAVRRAEDLEAGDEAEVRLTVLDS